MKRIVLFSLVCLLLSSFTLPQACALAPFKKAFQEKYVDKSEHETLKASFKKASCNTCHIKGEGKEERNDYGDELAKLIEGDANQRIKSAREVGDDARKAETEKILKELDKAFDEVAKKESKSKIKYGELLKAGKLPVEVGDAADEEEVSE